MKCYLSSKKRAHYVTVGCTLVFDPYHLYNLHVNLHIYAFMQFDLYISYILFLIVYAPVFIAIDKLVFACPYHLHQTTNQIYSKYIARLHSTSRQMYCIASLVGIIVFSITYLKTIATPEYHITLATYSFNICLQLTPKYKKGTRVAHSR